MSEGCGAKICLTKNCHHLRLPVRRTLTLASLQELEGLEEDEVRMCIADAWRNINSRGQAMRRAGQPASMRRSSWN